MALEVSQNSLGLKSVKSKGSNDAYHNFYFLKQKAADNRIRSDAMFRHLMDTVKAIEQSSQLFHRRVEVFSTAYFDQVNMLYHLHLQPSVD